jgi:DNA-3-methyladenine glycosylase I
MHDDVTKKRCSWAGVDDRLMLQYHDREWGVPVHDDRKHFEFIVLEAAQAGLSWTIVLKKREGYRRAFDGFEPEKVARYSARRIEKLALNSEIIRNRMKIEAAVRNARAFLKIQEEFGSFDSYCWRFVDGQPKLNRWKIIRQIPATSVESDVFRASSNRFGRLYLPANEKCRNRCAERGSVRYFSPCRYSHEQLGDELKSRLASTASQR